MISRGGSRVAATSKMGCFVIIVNGWTSLKICSAGYNNNQKEQSAIYEKLLTCEHYNYVVDLTIIPSTWTSLISTKLEITHLLHLIDKANN